MVAEKVQQLEQENISLKAQLEELQLLCGSRASIPKNCEYCKNFIQHYLKQGKSYYPISVGHCMAGNRVKHKKADETCKAFAEREYGKNVI